MIISALIKTGEKAIGGTLSAAEQTHHLSCLNAMLDSWSVDWSLIFQLLQESHALTSSVGAYTIGSGGAINTTRPIQIVDPCFVRDSSSIDRPLEIIDAVQYGRLMQKTLEGTYPTHLFYDNANVAGLATIRLYPEPGASLTLYFNSYRSLQSFATISDTVVLPQGYQRAIEFNYAIESAGGYGNVSPEVARIARDSLANVKRVNARSKVGVMQMDPGVVAVSGRGRWNIYTGGG